MTPSNGQNSSSGPGMRMGGYGDNGRLVSALRVDIMLRLADESTLKFELSNVDPKEIVQ